MTELDYLLKNRDKENADELIDKLLVKEIKKGIDEKRMTCYKNTLIKLNKVLTNYSQ